MEKEDFNPKKFLMKRMIRVRKYAYQITSSDSYNANLWVDSTGEYF